MQLTKSSLNSCIKLWGTQKKYNLEKVEKDVFIFSDAQNIKFFVATIGGTPNYKKLNHRFAQLKNIISDNIIGYIAITINSLSSVLKDYTKRIGFGIIEIDGKGSISILAKPKKKNYVSSRTSTETFVHIEKASNAVYITKEELQQFLDICSEDQLIEMLLVPLLEKIGFEDVVVKGHRDRKGEFGQDIKLMKFKLPTGHYLYFVAQVKKDDITPKNITDIYYQLKLAYEKKITDPKLNTSVNVDHVFLVTGKFITVDAQQWFYEQLEKDGRRGFMHIDREEILKMSLKGQLPITAQDEIKKFLQGEVS